MNQITASAVLIWVDGQQLFITEYLSACGCQWTVDMWGNVRRVLVCQKCLTVPMMSELQLGLFSPAVASE